MTLVRNGRDALVASASPLFATCCVLCVRIPCGLCVEEEGYGMF